jgi:two-component system CheB/CheR fusion protein
MNDELRQRTDDLNQANAFLESVLASLHAGAIVIDRNFTILMWNHEASALWGLRAEEVRGQSLLSLDIGLPVGQLRAPVRALLSGESTYEEIMLAATSRRGRAIRCRITCSPLLGIERDIQGALLLMEEWQ